MAKLRAALPGEIVAVLVDEGSLIAEEDELAVLKTNGGDIVIAASVPGVLREWFVGPGVLVEPGAMLALIDES